MAIDKSLVPLLCIYVSCSWLFTIICHWLRFWLWIFETLRVCTIRDLCNLGLKKVYECEYMAAAVSNTLPSPAMQAVRPKSSVSSIGNISNASPGSLAKTVWLSSSFRYCVNFSIMRLCTIILWHLYIQHVSLLFSEAQRRTMEVICWATSWSS